ncbi:endonuclease NucS domain-containing protein [Aureimonas sp. AU22]|uniref:endonuclease NucS domain-containing protein n=1 Tax=Aureimonas sp. AU22 TaxID=1638162 RepID=UPI000782D27B|nr:endonuclease NucS domain-containing protein [Aureimonas sp. AU22]
MRNDYQAWLKAAGYADNTIASQVHRVKKLEEAYGDLEAHLASGSLTAIVSELAYSTMDERAGRPNPSRLQFDGNIRNRLQSYKSALLRYERFLAGEEERVPERTAADPEVVPQETVKQKLALERDMQNALRRDIDSLEPGLQIVDDGAERAVETGFIDILCRDAAGMLVVVELKAGKADSRAIGQILGYMGDLLAEEDAGVRGIIVAHEFDQRTRSAARMTGSLQLRRYRVAFHFERD